MIETLLPALKLLLTCAVVSCVFVSVADIVPLAAICTFVPAVRAATTFAVSVTSALFSTPVAVEYPLKSWSPVFVPDEEPEKLDAEIFPLVSNVVPELKFVEGFFVKYPSFCSLVYIPITYPIYTRGIKTTSTANLRHDEQ